MDVRTPRSTVLTREKSEPQEQPSIGVVLAPTLAAWIQVMTDRESDSWFPRSRLDTMCGNASRPHPASQQQKPDQKWEVRLQILTQKRRWEHSRCNRKGFKRFAPSEPRESLERATLVFPVQNGGYENIGKERRVFMKHNWTHLEERATKKKKNDILTSKFLHESTQ